MKNSNPITLSTLKKFYDSGKKITVLTCYDYSSAKCIDEAGADIVLVGDSLAMVALGYETTHQVGIGEMEIFTKAVAKGAKRAFVVTDMPFMSYHASIEEGVKNAGALVCSGAKAVKLEGCNDYILALIKRLTSVGIPVVAHLGFTPQFLHALGGYKIQGKNYEAALKILEQAKELEAAGAFMLVLEMVPSQAAEFITKNISIPTIGIGAGVETSGQVLVIDDVLGKYSDFTPKFARKYADLHHVISTAVSKYVEDVENRTFPNSDETFYLDDEECEKLYGASFSQNR